MEHSEERFLIQFISQPKVAKFKKEEEESREFAQQFGSRQGWIIKIDLPGKLILILSKRKGLQEVLFSWKYYPRIDFPGRLIFIQLPTGLSREDPAAQRAAGHGDEEAEGGVEQTILRVPGRG